MRKSLTSLQVKDQASSEISIVGANNISSALGRRDVILSLISNLRSCTTGRQSVLLINYLSKRALEYD